MLFTAARWRGRRLLWPLMLTLLSICWNGCSPDGLFAEDQDRDRDFQRARDAERIGDYEGAAEFYERALERNPRSAVMHLGYASLCEGALRRYAYAVYHYQRYLRLRPDDPRAEDIRMRVTNCTERLATSVPLVVRSETIARDLDAMRKENLSLQGQIASLVAQTAAWSNEVRRLSLLARASEAANDEEPPAARSTPRTVSSSSSSSQVGNPTHTPSAVTSRGGTVHRIRPGDTLHRLARQYGVSLNALRQANPRINERRLLPGTPIQIPGR
jgi:LysM repeat protein